MPARLVLLAHGEYNPCSDVFSLCDKCQDLISHAPKHTFSEEVGCVGHVATHARQCVFASAAREFENALPQEMPIMRDHFSFCEPLKDFFCKWCLPRSGAE